MSKKSNNRNKSILELFSGQESILTIPKVYIHLTGTLVTALVLNQCIFYSGISKRDDGEFYKNYDEWLEETCLTKKQVIYAMKKLAALEFVITKIKKAKGAPTVHYTVNIEKITQAIHDLLTENSDSDKRSHKDKNSTKSTCTNIAPVLQKGTMDSDKRELSIVTKGNYPYTDELAVDLANECVVQAPKKSHTHNSNSQTQKDKTLAEETCQEQFKKKFGNKDISIEWLYDLAQEKVGKTNKPIGVATFLDFIITQKIDRYPDKPKVPKQKESQKELTQEEIRIQGIVSLYGQHSKMGESALKCFFPDEDKRAEAKALYESFHRG